MFYSLKISCALILIFYLYFACYHLNLCHDQLSYFCASTCMFNFINKQYIHLYCFTFFHLIYKYIWFISIKQTQKHKQGKTYIWFLFQYIVTRLYSFFQENFIFLAQCTVNMSVFTISKQCRKRTVKISRASAIHFHKV